MTNFKECILCKWFCENVREFILSVHNSNLDISFEYMVSDEMMSDVNVFRPGMHNWIFRNIDRACVITSKRNASKVYSIVK